MIPKKYKVKYFAHLNYDFDAETAEKRLGNT